METQEKVGDLLGVSLSPPALSDEKSTSEADAEALKRASAAGKEVAKASPVATLDDLTKMESSIMANLVDATFNRKDKTPRPSSLWA